MKKLILLVCMLLTGCAVIPHTPVSYRGDEDAIKPYVQLTGMDKQEFWCDKSTQRCGIKITVDPWIHNPTSFGLEGQLVCTYEVNGHEPPSSNSDLLKLGPKQSMLVSVSKQISIPDNGRSKVKVGCYFRYRMKNNFDHKTHHISFSVKDYIRPPKNKFRVASK